MLDIHPLAIKQGTVCSGFNAETGLCKHGHLASLACNPYKSPFDGSWKPNRAPNCFHDEMAERYFHRTGEQLRVIAADREKNK